MIEASSLPATDEVVPGQTIGKYEVLQRLAAGGMAEIFLARMVGVLGFDKLVVIKRILPHLASRNDFIGMFLDEARIATTLNHGNIVQTHEVGVHGKSYFMVMEYLAGEDVRTIVRRISRRAEARLPIAHALEIAIGVSAGLQYAHNKSDRDGKPLDIVHRDVTPQNVIVTYDGAVKLLDFGIAKAANRINETRSGSFKGKVPYMSPEQCRGEPLDRRSDIFSLGILLHELTLCRRLFKGDTDFQILKQIAEGPIPSPREIDPAYDPRLSAIVMKALERDPARRFATARELQEALAELAHDLRLRMSPLALADYMTALFADKVGAWQKASAEGDVAQLERHFATVMAEREADLAAEEHEGEGDGKPLYLPPPPSDVQLSSLPDAELALRPRGPARVLVAMLVAVVALGTWKLLGTRDARAIMVPHPAAAAAGVATSAAPSARPTMELPTPDVARDEAPATLPAALPASVAVTTTPPGATIVLDGKTLAEHSPAHVDVAAGVAHTLVVRTANHPGVVQRFTLDAGEEATVEVDLRRSQHAAAVRRAGGRSAHAATAAATSASATPVPPPVAPAPPKGDGTLVLASSPWCTVSVDGQARGTTPISVKLKAGPHEVVLANPEYKIKRTLAVDIEANGTVRKSLDFAPE